MATTSRGRKGFLVSVVGLILVVLGVLWLAVIFPALDKIPTGYERTFYFEGDFTVGPPGNSTSFPIEQIIHQKGSGTKDGALLIQEKRTVFRTDTTPPTDISFRYGDESTLAVDRHTLKFATDIDERNRSGYWGPPRGLGEGDTFELYHDGAGKPLTARYVREETFRGMRVVVFQIQEDNIARGTDPTSGLPLLLDVRLTLTIDPKSGTVVNQDSTTTTSMSMMGQEIPVQISNVRYAERTIGELLDVARDAQRSLLWFEAVIPWVLVGVGAFMVVIDTLFIGRRKVAKT